MTDTTPPADRAALLREAADALGRMDYDTESNDYGYDTYRDAWNGGVMDGADLLRRMADEAEPEPFADDTRNCVACGCLMRSHIRDDGGLRCAFCGCSDPVAADPSRMADEAQQTPEPESGCAHCGGDHAWDDCEAYTALVADEAQQPETGADTALRIRVLTEVLGRLTGSQDGDSATDDVPAATVRKVLAEILAGIQPGSDRGREAEQPAAEQPVEARQADTAGEQQ